MFACVEGRKKNHRAKNYLVYGISNSGKTDNFLERFLNKVHILSTCNNIHTINCRRVTSNELFWNHIKSWEAIFMVCGIFFICGGVISWMLWSSVSVKNDNSKFVSVEGVNFVGEGYPQILI